MNITLVLFGILPLIAFAIIDTFAGVRWAVVSAAALAILELSYTVIVLKTIDAITITTVVLVILFATITYRTKNPIFFKFQPVILGTVFGLILLGYQLFYEPLLLVLADKYQVLFPKEQQILFQRPELREILGRASHFVGWGFIVHAGIVAYTALHMSKWWWLITRGFGVYIMMFICICFITSSH